MPNETATLGCARCDQGFWVNPRNSADRRPCFNCNPNAARPAFRSNRFGFRRVLPPATNTNPLAIAAATITGPAAVELTRPLSRSQAMNDTAFASANPAEHAWLVIGAANGNDFAASLLRGMRRYGGLTPRQLACVQRNLEQAVPAVPVNADAVAPVAHVGSSVAFHTDGTVSALPPAPEDHQPGLTSLLSRPVPGFDQASVDAAQAHVDRLNARHEAHVAVAAPVPTCASWRVVFEAGQLRAALESAAASGLRKVRLTLGALEFRRGWRGRVRNTEGEIEVWSEGRWVGSIRADNTFRARFGCDTASLFPRIHEILADPRAAAVAHGLDTTHCACCRRLLTDPPSVMAGIGPVCITRFNWAF